MTLKRIAWSLRVTFGSIRSRSVSQLSTKHNENVEDKMQAWQIHSYGGLEELKFSNVRIPMIARPTDVLVKVEASSVNGIDIAMTRGYGATVLNFMRRAKNLTNGRYESLELPLTLGRDFSGTIASKGHGVGDRLKLGDKVWGVVPVEQQGCHANYVIVDSALVDLHPKNISYIEAASILYAGLTAWSALWLTGGLCYKTVIPSRNNNRVLILGGSGGVGTLAIQLAKLWNMHVVTTCSSDAVDLVEKVGADVAIDYKLNDADSKISMEGPYNIILDCANQGLHQIRSKGYPHSTYITLNSPLLKNIDEHGLIAGGVKNIGELIKYNVPSIGNKGFVKWGFFVPSQIGIRTLREYVETGKIVPVVEKVYPFQELPVAYNRVARGHLRGKIVIDMR
ncbi:NAD(P)H oxidoreductase RTN4IP1, mitochondrial [Nomia melanderi]|uniref:NAD(P)H oxidoreductase RTN4IP1, mitochondrial n=1 Tax=Nomia melanderi TaxID=2448451 RepID=UPI001303F9C7|nr:reticulon-4-interacting protein 1, mitochondrial [Nomia melanderi]XP_031838062.1 reticulon-4-interacting protein 1, mitochondrial [Nomia melanderi]XP_031838063.1 reticulon-4-interacting protein 1, mitochondrial [Nomia melanderi]XP_031838064.1 reticulon-4-interacting protein 1, mitochondrial [Nomia melanderi]XP_031838065.1 reticulon-4-interacting protein 1, mitochondrial [Nomia melanderi]XP_031838066.1 reticulon-4-interacting protein 1, mitochondrial [Nomia melanderi]XP_031838067.1 reticulo